MKKIIFIPFAVLLSTSFLLSQGTWTQKADFGGTARYGAIGFSIGTKGYIGAGVSGTFPNLTYYNDFWEWDQTSNAWTQKADFIGTARAFSASFTVGTKGYILAGQSASVNYLSDFFEWNQTTNMWSQNTVFAGVGRKNAIGLSVGNLGYAGLGTGISGDMMDFWQWDESSGAWIQRANFPIAGRHGSVSFSIGTKGYISVGRNNSNHLCSDLWEYNPSSNSWTQQASYPANAREFAIGFAIGSYGYVGLGHDSTSVFPGDLWKWDPSSNTWSQESNLSGTTRQQAVEFSIGTKGYMGTGNDGNNSFNDFWEFDPNGSGVNEIENQISFSVFPNPCRDRFTIMCPDLKAANNWIEIYSLQGEKIYSAAQTFLLSSVDISLPSVLGQGVYFIHLTSGNQTATKKIIIP